MNKLSAVEYEILDLLRSGGEMFGLQMVHASSKLKRGTVYVTLERMTKRGIVSSRKEEHSNKPGLPRRQYRITGQGTQILHAQDAFDAAMKNSIYLVGE